MSLLNAIGAASAAAALSLTNPATLTRNGVDSSIRASRHQAPKPSRAAQTGAAYDALIRVSGAPLPVYPQQNDTITLNGETFIIWRLKPSAAGGTIMAECMATPTEGVIISVMTEVPDEGGGTTQEYDTLNAPTIFAKLNGLSVEKTLTASDDGVLTRLMMRWPIIPGDPELEAGAWVYARGESYSVKDVATDDENPGWRRAMLVRSE